MALPKEPRQKMINLMYLVLTALLALNVSAEILNAFKTVNESLVNASRTIEDKNADIFKSFQQKLSDPKTAERAKIWEPKARQAKQMADALYNYIEDLKTRLKKEAGYNPPKDTTYKEDDLEAATRLMTDPGTEGKVLEKKLRDFRDNLLAIDPEIKNEFQKNLPIDLAPPKSNNQTSKDWASAFFRMTPTVAGLTILSKFQNDVKNSEAMVVDFCHRKVGEVILVLDNFSAFAGTNSQYLMPGQELQIMAGVGAFSKAARPVVSIDGQSQQLNDSGFVRYTSNVGGPGSYTKHIIIQYTKPDGSTAQVTKDVQYTVGSPTGASVSADAVKVLYIDLDNPLTVSANVGDERVSVTMTNGALTKVGAGKYIARPERAGKATITVSDGKTSTPFEFRVKDVPDPIAEVGINKGGRMKVNDFKAQEGVRAVLENFVFEGVKFTVTQYTIVLTGAGFNPLKYRQVTGSSFEPVRDLIDQVKPGTTVAIDEIKASGPGGTRTLPPIVFNLY